MLKIFYRNFAIAWIDFGVHKSKIIVAVLAVILGGCANAQDAAVPGKEMDEFARCREMMVYHQWDVDEQAVQLFTGLSEAENWVLFK